MIVIPAIGLAIGTLGVAASAVRLRQARTAKERREAWLMLWISLATVFTGVSALITRGYPALNLVLIPLAAAALLSPCAWRLVSRWRQKSPEP